MIIIISLLIFYSTCILILISAFSQGVKGLNNTDQPSKELISVIIPVRNEVDTINSLLADLNHQTYSNFEIIIVDDHSTDGTIEQIIERENLIVIPNDGIGKKQAITTGVRCATGAIIATTDADCSVHPEWLHEINKTFADQRTVMACGGVAIKATGSLFSNLQAIEFSSLIGSGAAMAFMGKPILCNGANLSYRKEVFKQVHGYDGNIHIASGDDEFLMRKIMSLYPKGIAFMSNSHSVVSTAPQRDFKSFFYQRIRWAGKWRFNSSWLARVTALGVLFFQMLTLLVIASCIINFSWMLFVALVIKIAAEAILLILTCRFLGVNWNWVAFLSLQFIYPVYVISIGILSNFVSYQWKQRRHFTENT